MKLFRSLRKVAARLYVRPTRAERHGHQSDGLVRLTFDDNGDADSIHAILEKLSEDRVRAGFFLIGDWVDDNPDLVAAIEAQGHWLGNHTRSHRRLRYLPPGGIYEQVVDGPGRLRPPFGDYGGRVRRVAARLGMEIWYWTHDTRDWAADITADEIIANGTRDLHPGAVILLHLWAPRTPEALPGLIREIRQRGLQLEELDGN
ncbi:MAG TPA: polysaccharide deacetylase family protein [Gammaproteobacteria bacterium]|nr:polysaccharide deacetylase family protein [Gammaproteobacteria bacterium]